MPEQSVIEVPSALYISKWDDGKWRIMKPEGIGTKVIGKPYDTQEEATTELSKLLLAKGSVQC